MGGVEADQADRLARRHDGVAFLRGCRAGKPEVEDNLVEIALSPFEARHLCRRLEGFRHLRCQCPDRGTHGFNLRRIGGAIS